MEVVRSVEYSAANLLVNHLPPAEIVKAFQAKSDLPPKIAMAMSMRDGNDLVSVEAVNHKTCIEICTVYDDQHADYVDSILHEAVESGLLNNKPCHHSCEDCWLVSPGIGLRVRTQDDPTRTVVLFRARGCGEFKAVMVDIEEKIAFLRKKGLNVFLVWVNCCPSIVGEECDLNG